MHLLKVLVAAVADAQAPALQDGKFCVTKAGQTPEPWPHAQLTAVSRLSPLRQERTPAALCVCGLRRVSTLGATAILEPSGIM